MIETHDSRDGTEIPDENRSRRKGIQPRIVLVLLLAGSFVGVWLSHLGDGLLLRSVWWLVIGSLGMLTGGLYWRVALFETSAFAETGARKWAATRWRKLESIGVLSFALSGAVVLGLHRLESSLALGAALLATGIVLSPVLWFVLRTDVADASDRTRRLRTLLLGLLVASLGGFAWVETGAGVVDWAVRFGHVSAFALWVGGAIWHNVLVLPAVRSGRTTEALKGQARRFRRHLVVVIPLFLLTGVYQAVQLVGVSPSALLESSVGWLIGFKLVSEADSPPHRGRG